MTGDSFQYSRANFSDTSDWHHVAGVFDFAGDTITLYIDGVAQTPSSVTFGNEAYTLGTPDPTTADSLGASNTGDNAWIAYFNGIIDDVRIYDYARSSTQITEDKDYAPNPTGDPMIAWYRFEDGGQIKETNLWSLDNDGDGWTMTYETQDKAQNASPGDGWVRRKDTVGSMFGNGRDGNVTFSTSTNLSTVNSGTRSCEDGGDAVSYNVTAFGTDTLANGLSGTTATVSPDPSSGCLAAGDIVMVINLCCLIDPYMD